MEEVETESLIFFVDGQQNEIAHKWSNGTLKEQAE